MTEHKNIWTLICIGFVGMVMGLGTEYYYNILGLSFAAPIFGCFIASITGAVAVHINNSLRGEEHD